jgi:hypothetical protein
MARFMAGVLLGVHAGSGVGYNTHAGCDTSLYHNQAVGNIDGCLLYTRRYVLIHNALLLSLRFAWFKV